MSDGNGNPFEDKKKTARTPQNVFQDEDHLQSQGHPQGEGHSQDQGHSQFQGQPLLTTLVSESSVTPLKAADLKQIVPEEVMVEGSKELTAVASDEETKNTIEPHSEIKTTLKRRRTYGVGESPEVKAARTQITGYDKAIEAAVLKIQEISDALVTQAKNQNVRKDIKDIAKTLPRKVKELTRSLEARKLGVLQLNRSKGNEDEDMADNLEQLECQVKTQEQEIERLRKKQSEFPYSRNCLESQSKPALTQNTVGTQTDSDLSEEKERKALAFRQKILESDNEPKKLAEFVSQYWPKKAFTSTKLVRASIQAGRDLRVLIIRAGSEKDEEQVQMLQKQFTSLDIAKIRTGLKPGKLAILQNTSSINIENDEEEGTSASPTRKLIIGKLDYKADQETNDDIELIKLCQRIAAEVGKEVNNEVMFRPPAGDVEKTRRALECCFVSTNIQIEVCAKNREKKKITSLKGNPGQRRRQDEKERPEVGVVVMKPVGKTFADMLKDVKTKLNFEDQGVTLQRVSATKDGEIRLQVQETRIGGRVKFTKTLADRAAELHSEVRVITRKMTLAIRGLDVTIEMTDLEEALKEAGIDYDTINLAEVKEGHSGVRTAIVRLEREAGIKLLKQQTIVVGWSKCKARVTEWEQPKCCYKCQKFGHEMRDCKDESGTKRCYRCGDSAHIAKACTAEQKCYVCGVNDHRADSIRCPKYQATRQQDTRPIGSKTSDRRQRRRDMEVKTFTGEPQQADEKQQGGTSTLEIDAVCERTDHPDDVQNSSMQY